MTTTIKDFIIKVVHAGDVPAGLVNPDEPACSWFHAYADRVDVPANFLCAVRVLATDKEVIASTPDHSIMEQAHVRLDADPTASKQEAVEAAVHGVLAGMLEEPRRGATPAENAGLVEDDDKEVD